MSEKSGHSSRFGEQSDDDDYQPQKRKKAKMGGSIRESNTKKSTKPPLDKTDTKVPQQLTTAAKVPQQRTAASKLSTEDVRAQQPPQDGEPDQQTETAFRCKNYAYVLQSLLKDGSYPKNFKFMEIESTENGKELKKFVTKINNLHKLILKDDVDGIKKILPIGSMKLYLNTNNHSALFIACTKKKFEVYSYLKKIGADFKNDKEREEGMKKFSREEKTRVEDINFRYFKKVENSYLEYLVGISEYENKNRIGDAYKKNYVCDPSGAVNFKDTMRNYYYELDKTPEISAILKVLELADKFVIVYDFDDRNVDKIACSNSKCNVGSTDSKKGRIVIAAKRDKIQILGTIAHELTHMAMDTVYSNSDNPYGADDKEDKKAFQNIVDEVCRKLNGFESSEEKKIIKDTFHPKYAALGREHSEAIVRVSQILIQCENGRTWLETNARNLWEYYKKVILVCENDVKKGKNKRVSDRIRNINETLGEILRIKKINLNFVNYRNLDTFLEAQNNFIFIIKTKNVSVTSLRALQSIYQTKYAKSCHEYFLLKLDIFIANYKKITAYCRNEVLKILILLIDNLNDSDLKTTISMILNLQMERTNLKIVFIIRNGEEKLKSNLKCFLENPDDQKKSIENLDEKSIKLRKKLKSRLKEFSELSDENFTINDLDEESVKNVMLQNLKFQGKTVKLNEIINENKNMFDLMDGDTTGRLCEGEALNIGGEILGTSSLDGAYSENVQKIDVGALCSHFRKSGYIFVINELEGENKFVALKEKIWTNINAERDLSFVNEICGKFKDEFTAATNKTILLTDAKLTDEEFKKFCSFKSDKKIFLIDVVSEEGKPVFLLKLYYNHNFYLKRNFKIVKDGKKEGASFDEEELLEKIKNDNLVIICDEPGMGKTTTLTKLYEKMSDEHWVIKIILKDSLDAIRKIDDKNFSFKNLVTFLTDADKNLRNNETKNFLKMAIELPEHFINTLFIFLDGYDEVLKESDRSKIIFLLENLKKHEQFKVWITTRPNFKNELEGSLSNFFVAFEKFSPNMIEKFIENHLRDHFTLVLSEQKFGHIFQSGRKKNDLRLSKYRNAFINKMKEIFGKETTKFIGTPLQLQLALANSFESFKKYIFATDKNYEPDMNFLGENLLDIYEKYLEMKYDVYFNKIGENSNAKKAIFKNSFNLYNKNLAEFLTLDINSSKNEEFNDEHKTLMHCSGILSNNSEFIHNTFREYFAALVIIDYLKNENNRKLNLNIAEILIKDIFLKPEFQLLRNFINLYLEKMNNWEGLPDLKEIGKVMGLLWGKNPTAKHKKGTVLHVALEENNKEIFKFIIYCCKKTLSNDQFYNLLIAMNGSFNTVFHIVASVKDTSLCQFLLDQVEALKLGSKCFRDLLVHKLNNGLTPLQLANGEVKRKRNSVGNKKKPNPEVASLIKAELEKLEVLLNLQAFKKLYFPKMSSPL